MPKPKLVESRPDHRTNVRYQGTKYFLAHDSKHPEGIPEFVVLDFNLYGCRLLRLSDQPLKYKDGQKRQVQFRINEHGQDGSPYIGSPVAGTVRSIDRSRGEFSFIFGRPLRLERIEPFEKFFVEPKVSTPEDRRRVYEQQEKVALSDLQELHAATRDNIARQFQLKIFALPTIGGLLVTGLMLNFESDIIAGIEMPQGFSRALAILVPVFCSLISLVAFIIYCNKTHRIRERTAFCTLLQRYITMGAFPPCYRGWHDAQSNMRHFELRGSEQDLFIDPKPIRDSIGIGPKLPLTKDPFTFVGMLAFGVLTIVSVFLAGYGLYVNLGDIDVWKAFVGFVIVAASVALVIVPLWREFQVQLGKRSTRHTIVRYSELLKCVPPFDPHNTGPLRFNPRDQY